MCNAALSLIEHTRPLTSLSDGSEEADACALHYYTARRHVLGDVQWHFAQEPIELASVLRDEAGLHRLPYVYQLGTDVLSVISFDGEPRARWRVMGKRNRLYASVPPPATVIAKLDVTDLRRWEASAVNLLKYQLASLLAGHYSRSQNRRQLMLDSYYGFVEEARIANALENSTDPAYDTDHVDWTEAARVPWAQVGTGLRGGWGW